MNELISIQKNTFIVYTVTKRQAGIPSLRANPLQYAGCKLGGSALKGETTAIRLLEALVAFVFIFIFKIEFGHCIAFFHQAVLRLQDCGGGLLAYVGGCSKKDHI